jgi:hypothetical protein
MAIFIVNLPEGITYDLLTAHEIWGPLFETGPNFGTYLAVALFDVNLPD